MNVEKIKSVVKQMSKEELETIIIEILSGFQGVINLFDTPKGQQDNEEQQSEEADEGLLYGYAAVDQILKEFPDKDSLIQEFENTSEADIDRLEAMFLYMDFVEFLEKRSIDIKTIKDPKVLGRLYIIYIKDGYCELLDINDADDKTISMLYAVLLLLFINFDEPIS